MNAVLLSYRPPGLGLGLAKLRARLGGAALEIPGDVLAARRGSNQWMLRRRVSGTCARVCTSTAAATSSFIIPNRTPSLSSATTQTNACTDRASLRTLAIRYDAMCVWGGAGLLHVAMCKLPADDH